MNKDLNQARHGVFGKEPSGQSVLVVRIYRRRRTWQAADNVQENH